MLLLILLTFISTSQWITCLCLDSKAPLSNTLLELRLQWFEVAVATLDNKHKDGDFFLFIRSNLERPIIFLWPEVPQSIKSWRDE